jgi:hypothetical protein
MAKKKVKSTPEQSVESLKTKIARLKKKSAAAADGPAKRKAKKAVKRTQRRKRAVAAGLPKPAAAT